MLALPIGLLTMAGGFVVRYLRHDHLDSLNVYLLETLLILLSVSTAALPSVSPL